MVNILSIFWSEYERFQAFADSEMADRRYWGLDEALRELLCKMENHSPAELLMWVSHLARERSLRIGAPVTLAEALRAWIKNLVTNRSKKYRCGSLLCVGHDQGYEDPRGLEEEEQIQLVQALTSPGEWKLLVQLANGAGYNALAAECGRPVSTLKSQISRCRRRVAASAASAA